tara:strand:+ start:2596 stop:3429 length:834 start_codon:yes stop_codon:yes gene_type:complete
MDSRFNCSLWIIAILVSSSFMACSKDDEPIIKEEVEVNHPVYVSEAEQGDYKNTYSYERVDAKIRLKQIDLYKFGFKKYDLKFKYDDQGRLIQCKRSVLLTDSKYHENVILNDMLPSDYTIQYGSNKFTVMDNDDISNTRTYSLGSDGFVEKVSWSIGDKSYLETYKRSAKDFISMDQTLSVGDNSTIQRSVFYYDDKNSVDYLRVTLPCLFSEYNILRVAVSDDSHDISRITYAYTYRTYDYPVTILKNEITFNGEEEVSYRTTTTLKYINADNIE